MPRARGRVAVANVGEASEESLLLRFGHEIPSNVGACNDPCLSCGAFHWVLERTVRARAHPETPHSYSNCCQQGGVELPLRHFQSNVGEVVPDFHKTLLTRNDHGQFATHTISLSVFSNSCLD